MDVQSILLLLASGAFALDVERAPTVQVSPREVLAGSYQHVRFTFIIGGRGLGVSGGVRVELPVAYLETEPYYWDHPQSESAHGRGFVSTSSSADVSLILKLYGTHGGIIECQVRRSALACGEQITIEYSGVVQSLTWDLPVRAQWRGSAQENWQDVENAPVITFQPQEAATLFAVAPADLQRGEVFDLAVVALDRFGNQAGTYRGTVVISATDPGATTPEPYTFAREDEGVHVFKHSQYNSAGFHRITLADGALEGRSNYSEVHNSRPEFKRYFGETHFHTGTGMHHQGFTESSAGGDHRGHFTCQDTAYRYVRDAMRLDFASASEHDAKGLDARAWQESQAIADRFYEPGRFTTFYGYEWTASPTEGHHVVLYKERGGALLDHFAYPSKLALFEALEQQQKPVLVIPHVMWAQPDHGIWDRVNNRYRRVGEIYSLWNSRFLLQPGDEPQRFELGIDHPWSYQFAWHRGHRIGLVGSSDNHTGRPGADNYTAYTQHAGGLAAVWAKDNNRDEIWDAIQRRRTYATSGARILLEFTADGHWMGEEYAADEPPTFSVKVAGSNVIQSVELVKYDGTLYQTIRTETPASEVCLFDHTDETFSGNSMYYVRVTQVDEHYRGPWSKPTCEMAWSSPIWVSSERD